MITDAHQAQSQQRGPRRGEHSHDQKPWPASPAQQPRQSGQMDSAQTSHELVKMLTAIIIVARVQPGTSKGITDLLLPQPSSGLKTSAVPLVYLSQRERKTGHKDRPPRSGKQRGNKRLRSRSLPSGLLAIERQAQHSSGPVRGGGGRAPCPNVCHASPL